MGLTEFYSSVGGDYCEVFGRMPSDAMIQKFVFKFLEDSTYHDLNQAVEAKDLSAAFRAAHTLKGLAYNLGFEMLGNAASDLTEQLRGATSFPDVNYLEKVNDVYHTTVNAISKLER